MRFGTQTSGSPFLEGWAREAPSPRLQNERSLAQPVTRHSRNRTSTISWTGRIDAGQFERPDAGEIFRVATAPVAGLGPCQVEASYRSVNGEFIRFPQSQPAHRDIEWHRRSNWDGQVEAKDGRWRWAFPLRHRRTINGCFVVSATRPPSKDATQLLTICVERATHTIQWRQCQYPQR